MKKNKPKDLRGPGKSHYLERYYRSVIARGKRYSKVSKTYIIYFLKRLNNTKNYVDSVLIYYNLTGKNPNISHSESKLIENFKRIPEQYSTLYKDSKRKNFINILSCCSSTTTSSTSKKTSTTWSRSTGILNGITYAKIYSSRLAGSTGKLHSEFIKAIDWPV